MGDIVWLLWRHEQYEPPSLLALYASEDKASQMRDELERLGEDPCISYSVENRVIL